MSLRVEVKLCRENILRGCLLEEGEAYAGRNQGKKRGNELNRILVPGPELNQNVVLRDGQAEKGKVGRKLHD